MTAATRNNFFLLLDFKFSLKNEDKNLYNWNSATGEKAVSVLPRTVCYSYILLMKIL
jgi:hypothetical protein